MSPSYPTRDHVVPVRWWDVAVAGLEAVEARQTFFQGFAVAHGHRLATDAAAAPVRSYTRMMERRAFPILRRLKPRPEEVTP